MYILQYVCFINDIVKAWAEAKYLNSPSNFQYNYLKYKTQVEILGQRGFYQPLSEVQKSKQTLNSSSG